MLEFELAPEWDAIMNRVREILTRETKAGNDNPGIKVAVQLGYMAQGIVAVSEQYSHFAGKRPKGNLGEMAQAQTRGIQFFNVDWHGRIHHECDGICNRCSGCGILNRYSTYYGHFCERPDCPANHDVACKYIPPNH